MTNAERLEQLAADVLDGRAVDWIAAESTSDAAQLDLIRCLKVVAAVADVQRPPDHWGHLRLLERIGGGTFGDVYRAWDSRLDRDVALKLVLAREQANDRNPSSIIEEGRLLARVCHPNVVTIHGAEQIGDRVGLWMELVRGRTLEQILADGGRFSAAEVVRIGVALSGAVQAVHISGLLHRDIKAHNVMLADDGRVVLMDFGAGRELAAGAAPDLTGTPLYAAPEVLANRPATVQSDVYSLGVLCFHLLSGSYPVQGRTLDEIRAAHATPVRSSLRAVRPDVGRPLARAIELAVDAAPDRRYPTAAAFAEALRKAGRGGTRRWLARGAVAAAAVGAAIAFVWIGRPAGVQGSMPSIAVLPFEDRSARPEGNDLADGLTREIHRGLATIDGLTLRSAGASFPFQSQPRNLDRIASELGVDYIVEGTIVRAGTRLQIEARFTHLPGREVLWTDRFDRESATLPTIVNDISRGIVDELGVTRGRAPRHYELAPDLYYQFLRARAFHGRRGPENSTRAAALFQEVASSAPDFAPAWAGLANSLAQLSRPSLGEAIIPPDPRIAGAALKAFRLDPLLAEAHAAVAGLYARDRDWVNARMAYLKALDLDPSLTETYSDFVLGVLMPIGDIDEALRQLDAARRADPLSLDVRRVQAHVFIDAGRYDDAIENCRWIKRHDPAFPYVDVWLGRALYLSGRYDEARQALERAGPDFFGYLGYLFAVSGQRAAAEALIASNPDKPSRTMLIHAGLGDRERAFEMLTRTAEINWWRAATWLRRPEMALLRGDPRMPALLQKLGVPE